MRAVERFYLPAWSLEELLAAVNLDEPSLPTEETVAKLFHVWGGNAR